MLIEENLKAIRSKIEKAAHAVNRASQDVQLVAVSKKQSPDKIEQALRAGQRLFGENRVQEAQEHWSEHRKTMPDLKLHLIGPLQTNKAKEALALFDLIETLDREKLAITLAGEMQRQNRKIPCFIQVNTGEEPQKSGITPKEVPQFLEFCQKDCDLIIQGLMCIPPVDESPALHFALLKNLTTQNKLTHCSMGMSHDYETAIKNGATFIRIGTAIFGQRPI